MPIIKSAIKRMRQTAKRRVRNVETKRDIKGAVKTFLAAPTSEGLRTAQSEIDTAVKKNVLNKNTASRRKARLARIAREAGVTFAAAKPATKKPATAEKPKAASTSAKPAAKKPVGKAADGSTTTKSTVKKPAVKRAAPKKAAK